MIEYQEFCRRVDALKVQIAEACRSAGRSASDVELLPVTKTHPAVAAEYASRYGLRAVGENRVQEAAEKKLAAPIGLKWELIGHLQSNKAKPAVEVFDRIQTVDSEKLLVQLDRAAAANGKRLPILLQINAGNDPAKFGADLTGAPRLLECALMREALIVEGLMTIAPLSSDPDVARRTFAALRELRDKLAVAHGLALHELSMGMSGDWEIAIQEGSTQVRVGTALFGERETAG